MSEVLSVELSAEDKARLEWASEKTQRSEADFAARGHPRIPR
ncbi:hypothetical protein [Mobiluncus mulieris]|nr:hypothetical protein [Mobiluncus mulieris]